VRVNSKLMLTVQHQCCYNQRATHHEHAPRSSLRHGLGIDNRHRSIGSGSQQCTLATVVVVVIIVIIIVIVVIMIIIIVVIIVL
jgi:hypothetical protein